MHAIKTSKFRNIRVLLDHLELFTIQIPHATCAVLPGSDNQLKDNLEERISKTLGTLPSPKQKKNKQFQENAQSNFLALRIKKLELEGRLTSIT